jgi:hypothetical protein
MNDQMNERMKGSRIRDTFIDTHGFQTRKRTEDGFLTGLGMKVEEGG